MHFEGDTVRQVGKDLSEISPHHLNRYFFAASLLNYQTRVIDVGCGCGYGTWILWSATGQAAGLDISQDAINWANHFYKGPQYVLANASKITAEADAAVIFELIEHIEDPLAVLKKLDVKQIIASVPNEEKYPFVKEKFTDDSFPHLRHYTPDEFEGLLNEAGFKVLGKFCQVDKRQTGIRSGTDGKFLIYLGVKENAKINPV